MKAKLKSVKQLVAHIQFVFNGKKSLQYNYLPVANRSIIPGESGSANNKQVVIKNIVQQEY
ncbi:MAG: hypothetical protein JST86_15560 [Bacteroidetes bacterium]|nr:hypothetical protein [Bacteroidota bacterium]